MIAGLLRHPAASFIKTKDFPLRKVLELAIQLCLSNSVKMGGKEEKGDFDGFLHSQTNTKSFCKIPY